MLRIFKWVSGLAVVLLLLCCREAPAEAQAMAPDLAAVYPAGGQAGTSFDVLVAGQSLRGLNQASVSGRGVNVEVVRHYPPFRRLKPEEMAALREEVTKRVDECWQEQLDKGLVQGEMPWKGKGGFLHPQDLKKMRKKPFDFSRAKIPPHPLLDDIGHKSLKEIEHVFFSVVKNRFMRQPNPQMAETVLLRVSIDKDAPPGNRSLRLYGRRGISDSVVFQVGEAREERELESNDPDEPGILPPASPAQLPVVINGRILPGDVDEFRVELKAGRLVEIQVAARELVPFLADAVPGWFQACLSLHDPTGREIRFVDDVRFSPDPRMHFEVPLDGIYAIQVRDSLYRGREDFVYRLSIREIERKRLPEEFFRLPALETDLPISDENDRLATVPRVIKGVIEKPGEKDSFRFRGQKGQAVVLEVKARRLGSPLDSLVQIYDSDNKSIAFNDDAEDKKGILHRGIGLQTQFADSFLCATLPRDDDYTVKISDACQAGSPEHAYWLRISEPRPDFALLMTPSAINLTAGMDTAVQIHVLRSDGFQGEIDLTVEQPPEFSQNKEGFSIIGGTIPSQKDSMNFTIRASGIKKPRLYQLSIIGTSIMNGRRIVRKVQGADNVMQAFLWRHLVPSETILANVAKNQLGIIPRLTNSIPVSIPSGGKVEIRYSAPGLLPHRDEIADLKLLDPPESLKMDSYQITPTGISLTLVYDGEESGADHVIPEVFIFGKGKKKPKLSAGFLPSIPVKFGCSPEEPME